MKLRYLIFLSVLISAGQIMARQNVPATAGFLVSGRIKSEKVVALSDLQKLKRYDLGDINILNH